MNTISTLKNKTKLKKIGNRYFLPFEIWNYFDFASMLFFIILAGFMINVNDKLNYLFLVLLVAYLIKIATTIKDRFFVEIKTFNTLDQNIALIKELALRQPNFSESLDEQGLFVFEYSEKNIFYKYNIRKRDYIETVVVYCEENTIWLNSYNQRYLGLFRRYNLKQWIKLIYLKTKATKII